MSPGLSALHARISTALRATAVEDGVDTTDAAVLLLSQAMFLATLTPNPDAAIDLLDRTWLELVASRKTVPR